VISVWPLLNSEFPLLLFYGRQVLSPNAKPCELWLSSKVQGQCCLSCRITNVVTSCFLDRKQHFNSLSKNPKSFQQIIA
jgi:hypothetical protein